VRKEDLIGPKIGVRSRAPGSRRAEEGGLEAEPAAFHGIKVARNVPPLDPESGM